MDEIDTPWKEALDDHLFPFLALFFPLIYDDISTARGYESLDQELEPLARDGEIGGRLVDKLFKVWRKDGQETWVLIHVEVQGQYDADFPLRMYIYNFRIFDKYQVPVVSLAVLADSRKSWRPRKYESRLWGCRVLLEFPMVKLLDFLPKVDQLAEDQNPFALFVVAHLLSRSTRRDMPARRIHKFQLFKKLLERGYDGDEVRRLLRLIDWAMALPIELEKDLQRELLEFEQEKRMPYVTSFERLGYERGIKEGVEEGIEKGVASGRLEGIRIGLMGGIETALEIKFGAAGMAMLPRIRKIDEVARLSQIQTLLRTVHSLDEIEALLPKQ